MTTADENRADSEAVAAWYVEHAGDLRAFLLGVLKSRELADEVLQSTFAKALESDHPPRRDSLRGWLFQVAFREALVLKRKKKIHDRAVDRLAWMTETSGESSDQSAGRAEMIDRVRLALGKLPQEQQSVVRMRIYENMTFAEIAQTTNAPLGTVLTRMRLALEKLQDQLRSSL